MEEQNTNQEMDSPATQGGPSTSNKGKRKPNPQGKQPAAKQQRVSTPEKNSEARILPVAKAIMEAVKARLQDEDKLSVFLKKKITELDKDKRVQIGVFGETGAGKSSLINTIIDEKNLLPSSNQCTSACTSVIIKVEASIEDKYQALIEFLTTEEWNIELWSLLQSAGDKNNEETEDDDCSYADADADDDSYIKDKLSALYGEEWKKFLLKDLMEKKIFSDIHELLKSGTKTFTCKTAVELSDRLAPYTRNRPLTSESKTRKGNRCYWPLVKCVTVKVPNKDLLQHVTLVDLPGNGDCNKSRDQMWKKIVGDCSVVWIVTEIKRAGSKGHAWIILNHVSRFIGNGGECQHICFICSKSDETGISHGLSQDDVHKLIVDKNKQAKEEVQEKMKNKKKPFSFEVFTVSSREFLQKEHLDQDETEIPKLQRLLKKLNNVHSETENYVSGAFTILSLIQDAKHKKAGDEKENVCAELQKNLRRKREQIKKEIEDVYETFEKCLRKGVENSEKQDEKKLKMLLDKEDGRGFHRTLKSVVQGGGVHKKRKEINFNVELALCLTNSIDEKFSKIFPCAPWSDTVNQAVTHKPFNGSISAFSLGTDSLTTKYKDLKLQLDFLKMEEEKMKEKLNNTIRMEKKMIYHSLLETIETKMKECYEKAAKCHGEGSLIQMRNIIKSHVQSNKGMYEEAKNAMLEKLDALKSTILEDLENSMAEAIEFSLRTDDNSLPDVAEELERVTKLRDETVNIKHCKY